MIQELALNDAITYGIDIPISDDFYREHQILLDPKLMKAAKGRREEFVAGRACAQKAIESLSYSNVSVGFAEDRKPIWPMGIVGSITHSKKIAIASIGLTKDFVSIGIDCEVMMTKDKFDSLSKHLATTADLQLFSETNEDLTATLIFSAKESLYKLINPLCNTFFGFDHASLRSINEHSFEIELHSSINEVKKFNKIYYGNYIVVKNQVVTSLIIRK